MDFPLSTICVLQSTLRVSYDNRHRIACLLPSLTALHYYFVLILRVAAPADLDDDGKLGERGIYTDYVIVSTETSLGIAAIDSSDIFFSKSFFILNNFPTEIHCV